MVRVKILRPAMDEVEEQPPMSKDVDSVYERASRSMDWTSSKPVHENILPNTLDKIFSTTYPSIFHHNILP